MATILDALRTGSWLSRERIRLVAAAVLVASLAGLVWLAATSDGLNDAQGRPLGTDFSNVYAAGTYVLDGEPAAPFDPARQLERERAIFGAATPFFGWHYPPFFLGLAALLATMPYWLALLVWQASTLALYLWVMLGISNLPLQGGGRSRSDREGVTSQASERSPPAAPSRFALRRATSPFQGEVGSLWLLLALAFPAVVINIGQGHNGFLTTALMTGALLQLDRRPIVAGILIGLMAYKPQFGLLLPLVLAASGRWRVFIAAAVTVALMTLAVTLAFGVDVWSAFLASGKFTREVVLEQGGTGWHKIQSVFSWVRMWGGGVTLAYAVQGIVSLAVAVSLVWLWRRPAPFAFKAAALLIGTLLATPYSLDYDLMLLAPAIAVLAVDGLERGFAPWQKTLLAALWLMPLIARSLAQATLIPLAAPLMLLTFAFLLQRARTEMRTG